MRFNKSQSLTDNVIIMSCAGTMQTIAIYNQAHTNLGDIVSTTHLPTDEPHPKYETIGQYERSDLSQISSSQIGVLDSEQQPHTSLNICYLTLSPGQ